MNGRAGNATRGTLKQTRRDVLKTGLVTGFSLGAASLVASLSAATADAASQGVYGGHATVLHVGYPEVWDPHIAGTLLANAAISPLYNQVVEFNPIKPDEVIGDLAKSWEAHDEGLTYIFHLHENVKWWDGHDLTAEDVAFSINRMIEPDKARPRTGLLRPSTKSVEVLDRHTVQVHLNHPSPSFIKFLAVDYMKMLPQHIVEAGVDINRWENIVGSGPFKIVKTRRGESVTYEKNPAYFKPGRPFLDGFTLLVINDAGTAAAAVKAGKIHATTGVTALTADDQIKLAQDLHEKYAIYWQPYVTDGWHVFGNVEKEPWNDLRIIKALRLATDQWEHQKAFGAGHYKVGAPFPVDSWYGSTVEELSKLPGYRQPKEQDLAEAKALLQGAGYDPPSKLGKRILNTGTVSFLPDAAQLWVAQMRRNLGLDIEIKLVDGPTAIKAHTSGDFDLGIWGYGFNIDDPDDWVNAVYGPGSRNYTRWKHPAFLKMFDQQTRRARSRQAPTHPPQNGRIPPDGGRPLYPHQLETLVVHGQCQGPHRGRSFCGVS